MEFVRKSYIGLLIVISLIGYVFISEIRRVDHFELLTTYAVLFICAILMGLSFAKSNKWIIIFGSGLAFRLVFLLAQPQLSDDYFRFTWDGELQKDGISAFAFVPGDYANYFQDDPEKQAKYKLLFEATMENYDVDAPGMNSAGYYSIYPAVNQSVFYCASMLGTPNQTNVVFMRLFILLAEIISFFALRSLLVKKNTSSGLVALYWLNPLVVIEVTGNLHFDGVAITFILLALVYLNRSKFSAAGIALALAIHTKLNPLFLVGAVFNKISFKRFILFAGIGAVLTVLLFATIMDTTTFWNFKKSFGLYFAWFSFNAGPYGLVKELGLLLTGFDLSSKISLVFPFLTIAFFTYISFKSNKSIAHKLLLLYLVYFTFTPVVHPWYLVVLIPLGILSEKLYPILWSFLAFFTYVAYGSTYGESSTIVYLEFACVYLLMYFEYKKNIPAIEKLKKGLFKNSISESQEGLLDKK